MSERTVIPRERLRAAAQEWHRARRTIVFTNGVFDLLHPGHLQLLEDSASQGDVLMVAINSDESVKRLKGAGRPVYPAAERAEILLSVRWVDAVTIFEEDTPLETIRAVRPHVLVKGAEYGAGAIVGEEDVLGWGGRVWRYPMRAGLSTSRIVDKIRGTGPK
ncbi:MAG TPA: adenylyltransferase/cytidyltransferase family protein [Candidatus Krumholzibacteria bacterium]|nr:adenylyltransferase/cytidyltransferase family protein [Candidatus Krumholzibacteria bacterium]